MLMIYQKLSMKTLNKEHLQILSIFLNIFNNNWLEYEYYMMIVRTVYCATELSSTGGIIILIIFI